MKTLCVSLEKNLAALKNILTAEDILVQRFSLADKTAFAIIYADGLVDKETLGLLVSGPLEFLKKDSTGVFPDLKRETEVDKLAERILEGNAVLLKENLAEGIVVGARNAPARAVGEPPTGITVKGPREGFVEDVKTNTALIRKRLKTPNLRFESFKAGKQSSTDIVLCYLKGIADEDTLSEIREKIKTIDIDFLPDSSYVAELLCDSRSVFPLVGSTEKPDVFCAKLSEGRVGILSDGSPEALTAPLLFVEHFQSADDYFTSPFTATVTRILRAIAVLVALYVPALYVSSQLFKLQLLPLNLTLTIASSIQGIPLSPSLEMFLVLFVLEVIKEASIRMPKYVGMALSVVGALVLGETAVSAGFVSTPAIIIVAFSGLCLYTVPDFTETGALLRWIFLLVAGSFGPFGIVLFTAFLLYYAVSVESFGTPILAPFSPLIESDLKDTIVKFRLKNLKKRPRSIGSKNKTRLREKEGS